MYSKRQPGDDAVDSKNVAGRMICNVVFDGYLFAP